MKISILDGSLVNPGDLSWEQLQKFGEVEVHDVLTKDLNELIQRAGNAEILLGDGPDLPEALIAACPKAKLICVMATGYDSVGCEYAREHGITVCNVPSYGTAAVSQYAISLLLEICGHAAFYSQQVHQGRWYECDENCFTDHRLIELDGKTMGIIGFGRIGQRVGTIAKAFGMKVIAYNRSRCEAGSRIGDYVTLDELFSRSDVISLHAPLNEASYHIVNSSSIGKMKAGVIIINNGRGGLVDSAALAEALKSGKVYAAGLDVIESEPIGKDNPLLASPHCLITPHISWLPREARQRIIDITEENIRAFLSGEPQNVVNSNL